MILLSRLWICGSHLLFLQHLVIFYWIMATVLLGYLFCGFCCFLMNSIGLCFVRLLSCLQISLILSRTVFKFCYSRSRISFTLGLHKPSPSIPSVVSTECCGYLRIPTLDYWNSSVSHPSVSFRNCWVYSFLAIIIWPCGVSLSVDSGGRLISFLCIAVPFLVLANCNWTLNSDLYLLKSESFPMFFGYLLSIFWYGQCIQAETSCDYKPYVYVSPLLGIIALCYLLCSVFSCYSGMGV